MPIATRSVIRILLATSALAAANPAFAEQADAQQPAAAESAEAGGLVDIVVTARRRAERAQETPISLSVATGETLVNRSVTSFIDVQRQTPSLHIAPAALSATATNLSMRGQALTDIRLNIDPAVAIYIDGVYLPRAQGSNASDLIDIDRVEVLAGPQGTLYGKNTTGGAVTLYSKLPTDNFEGFMRGRVATYGETNIAGMLNLPISAGAMLRIVGSITDRDGYGKNTFNGDDAGALNSRYGRATLLLEPSDALRITLRGDYTKAKITREVYKGLYFLGPVNQTTGAAPVSTLEAALERGNFASAVAFNALPLATRIQLLNEADADLRRYVNGDADDGVMDQSSKENVSVWGVSGQIDYDFNDSLAFKSITALRGFLRRSTQDLDGTPYSLLQYPFQRTKDRQFSQEVQLGLNTMDDRLNAIVGLYYSDEEGRERIDQVSVRVISGVNALGVTDADVDNESFGVFGQASFKFTDQFSATGGLRYSKDKRFLNAMNYNATFCTSLGVTLASIGGVANCQRPESVQFSKVNYTASLEYRPTRDIMVYVKTSRGYRSGGLQEAVSATTPALANATFTPFKPETVTDYELGLKSDLFDRRLRVNLTYYHSILDDAIRTVSVPIAGEARPASRAQNAAKVKVDGIEFDITAVPVDGLELGLNGAYTDGRFASYITPTGEDRSNLPLLFTPKWQIGGSVAYTAELSGGRWRTQGDISYTGRQLSAEPAAFSPKHTIFNARTSVDIDAWDLNIALYGKNLTNRRYPPYPVDVAASLGFKYQGILSPPRTAGVEITKKF